MKKNKVKFSDVPVFILAGGLGTRLSEETDLRPKPMIEIGEVPILLHIMRSYYSYGFNDFVICAGYKSWEIKEYFLNYSFRTNHLKIDHRQNRNAMPKAFGDRVDQENWRVRVIDTGLSSMTGARVAKAFDEVSKTDHIQNFALTYGDGLTDAHLADEYQFHLEHNKIGTVLGVPPQARFGELALGKNNEVFGFLEKPESRHSLINGGFFFFKSSFRKFLTKDNDCVLEKSPLTKLAQKKQLKTFVHKGFWHPMDTLRDKNHLQKLWDEGKAPWKS